MIPQVGSDFTPMHASLLIYLDDSEGELIISSIIPQIRLLHQNSKLQTTLQGLIDKNLFDVSDISHSDSSLDAIKTKQVFIL